MIVVFGSINLDLVGSVERLPRAGETLRGKSFSMSPGGKGANQALAARRAGAAVAMVGVVGRDPFAEAALSLLRADSVDLANVRVVSAATGVALIHVDDQGENAITVIAGVNAEATADQVPDEALEASTIVVMQLETPLSQVVALAARARARGARVILNAAPTAPLPTELLDHVDVLIVNETEAQTLAGVLRLPTDPQQFVTQYRARFRADAIVSLGAQGLVASADAAAIELAAPEVNVVDTVGAGDALVGALAAALDRGAPWIRALKEGVAAGSLACTQSGAQSSLPRQATITALADTI
jgi:ribokinase